jgi:hypothetical protein
LTNPRSEFGSSSSAVGLPEAGLRNTTLTNIQEERPMSDRSSRAFIKRQVKHREKSPSTKPSHRIAEWENKDERLDDALRQTFPASDALSIVQNVRGS